MIPSNDSLLETATQDPSAAPFLTGLGSGAGGCGLPELACGGRGPPSTNLVSGRMGQDLELRRQVDAVPLEYHPKNEPAKRCPVAVREQVANYAWRVQVETSTKRISAILVEQANGNDGKRLNGEQTK